MTTQGTRNRAWLLKLLADVAVASIIMCLTLFVFCNAHVFSSTAVQLHPARQQLHALTSARASQAVMCVSHARQSALTVCFNCLLDEAPSAYPTPSTLLHNQPTDCSLSSLQGWVTQNIASNLLVSPPSTHTDHSHHCNSPVPPPQKLTPPHTRSLCPR